MQKENRQKMPSSEFQKKRMYIINGFVKEKFESGLSAPIGCPTFEDYFQLSEASKTAFYIQAFTEEEKKQHSEKIKQMLINN